MWVNLVCLAALLGSTRARLEFGSCKTSYPSQNSFSMINYSGKWYLKYSFDQESDSCITTNYQFVNPPDNQTVTQLKIHNFGVNKKTNKTTTKDGIANLKNPQAEEGEFMVSFSNDWWFDAPRDYFVIATDFYTFALVYTCSPKFWLFRSRQFWILTRKPDVSSIDLILVRVLLGDYGIDMSEFNAINHDNCNYQ